MLTTEVFLQGEGGVTWSLLEPALSNLKHALAAEHSQRGIMRGLKSVQREPKTPITSFEV